MDVQRKPNKNRRAESASSRFTLLRLLRSGSEAAVFVGRDEESATEVAIKIPLRSTMRDPRTRARLWHELRLLAALESPWIVPLLSVTFAFGGPALVMPLLEGETLRARLDRSPTLRSREALIIVDGVLRGLEDAHRVRVVHRDVKPSNLFLVTPDARPMLLDFGIAKHPEAEALTSQEHILGTPSYVAPEQILGGRVDVRTDLYAVGVMLFEMLVGQPPFTACSPEALIQMHLDRTPPLHLLEGHSPALIALVSRALEKCPRDRWPSASSMRTALSHLDEVAR